MPSDAFPRPTDSRPGIGDCPIVRNLVLNPDFESGYDGFYSEFTRDTDCGSGVENYGPHPETHYTVNSTPQQCHGGYSNSPGDKGKMLLVNFPAPGAVVKRFWCQDVPVNSGKQYKIEVRLRAAVPVAVSSQPTKVAFTSNGDDVLVEFPLEADWKMYRAVLTPPDSGSVKFCAEARTQNAESTDLVMDDILFGECSN